MSDKKQKFEPIEVVHYQGENDNSYPVRAFLTKESALAWTINSVGFLGVI